MKLSISFLLGLIALPAFAISIPLSNAGATFSQSGYHASKSIDNVVAANNGWAIAPNGNSNISQRIWWEASGVAAGPARAFDFEMNFRGTTGAFDAFNMRRFSIAYTTDAVVSANSNWTEMMPLSATTSDSGSSLSINAQTKLISLGGGSSISNDYYVRASIPASGAITGFSVLALSVNGQLGTHLTGNFVLTEFSASTVAPLITVPESLVLSEGSGPYALRLRSEQGGINVGSTWNSTATSGSDLTLSISNNYTFSFGVSQTSTAFIVEALNDASNEGVEWIDITWTPNAAYVLSAPTTRIYIGDTDGSGFDDYVAGHGLSGNDALPLADPNGDGISNVEAFAFRLNPAGPFPSTWRERLPTFTTTLGGRAGNLPAITWNLPQPWPSDVRFAVYESEDLVEWTEVARRTGYGVGSLWTGSSSSGVQESGSPLKTLIVPGTFNMNTWPRTFMRLTMTKVNGGGGTDLN